MITMIPSNAAPVVGDGSAPFAAQPFAMQPQLTALPGVTMMPAESSLLGREASALLGTAMFSFSGAAQSPMTGFAQSFFLFFMLEMMKKLLEIIMQLLGKKAGTDGGAAASALGGSLGSFLGTSGGASPSGASTSGTTTAGSSTQAATGSASVDSKGHAFPVAGIKPGTQIKTHWGTGERGATDIFAPEGTPVYSISDGTVESAGTSPVSGNKVTIKGNDGLTYFYAHLQHTPMVSAGQKVKAGQQIGHVGDTGNAKGTGHHLHLGIGYGINSGTGPRGGAGNNFDAVTFLQKILDGK
jgi:hypothetical protein